MRIVRVVHDFVALAQDGGSESAIKALQRRRGHGHDPQVVDAVLADPDALVRVADVPDAWDRIIDAEPAPMATVSSAGLESVARAFGEFTDLKVGVPSRPLRAGGRACRDGRRRARLFAR